jgi:hypothetical protein
MAVPDKSRTQGMLSAKAKELQGCAMDTKIYYSSRNIWITNDRVQVGRRAYPIVDISNVKISRKSLSPGRLAASIFIALGNFVLVWLQLSKPAFWSAHPEVVDAAFFMWGVLMAGIFLTGFYRRLMGWVLQTLTISGPFGEVEVISSWDMWLISDLYRAIKKAIRDHRKLMSEGA